MSNEITTKREDTIEVITIDYYTGEGLDELNISIYNKLCGDLANICLNESEVRKLRDLLNEWIQ